MVQLAVAEAKVVVLVVRPVLLVKQMVTQVVMVVLVQHWQVIQDKFHRGYYGRFKGKTN
jgi:hypothetical protein